MEARFSFHLRRFDVDRHCSRYTISDRCPDLVVSVVMIACCGRGEEKSVLGLYTWVRVPRQHHICKSYFHNVLDFIDNAISILEVGLHGRENRSSISSDVDMYKCWMRIDVHSYALTQAQRHFYHGTVTQDVRSTWSRKNECSISIDVDTYICST